MSANVTFLADFVWCKITPRLPEHSIFMGKHCGGIMEWETGKNIKIQPEIQWSVSVLVKVQSNPVFYWEALKTSVAELG